MLNEILNILGKMISADVKAHKNNTEVLKDHLLILQNELTSKNEVIKSLMGTQSAASKQSPLIYQLVDFTKIENGLNKK